MRPARSTTTILTAATRLASSSSFTSFAPSTTSTAQPPPPPQPAFTPLTTTPVVLTGAQRRRLAILGTLDETPVQAEPSILFSRAQHVPPSPAPRAQPIASSSRATVPPSPQSAPVRARSYAPEVKLATSLSSASKMTAAQKAMVPPRRPGATAPVKEKAAELSKKRPWEAGNHE